MADVKTMLVMPGKKFSVTKAIKRTVQALSLEEKFSSAFSSNSDNSALSDVKGKRLSAAKGQRGHQSGNGKQPAHKEFSARLRWLQG